VAANHRMAEHEPANSTLPGDLNMTEKSIDEMTESELAKHYEDHIDDDEFWEKNFSKSSITIPKGTPSSTVFTMRIDPMELHRVFDAANESGLSASEFVRRACLAALEDRDRLKVAVRAKAAKEVKKKVKELAEAASKL
jgi:hypothetical protein